MIHNTSMCQGGDEPFKENATRQNPNFNVLFPPGIVCICEGTAVTSYCEYDLFSINNQWDVTFGLKRDTVKACCSALAPTQTRNEQNHQLTRMHCHKDAVRLRESDFSELI